MADNGLIRKLPDPFMHKFIECYDFWEEPYPNAALTLLYCAASTVIPHLLVCLTVGRKSCELGQSWWIYGKMPRPAPYWNGTGMIYSPFTRGISNGGTRP